MALLSQMRMRLRALLQRDDQESEMRREMASHIAMEAERLEQDGLAPNEARRRAMIAFGGVERYKEGVRDEHGTRWLDELAMDVRIATRTLRKRRAFAFSVIITLAIGIGSTTAVFSWANWLLIRPIPGVFQPERLLPVLFETAERNGGPGLAYRNFLDLRASSQHLHALTATSFVAAQVGAGDLPPRDLDVEAVAGDYFGVLGLRAQRGRFFTAEELDQVNTQRIVVISDELWRSQYGATPDIIGRQARFNAADFVVVGVAPQGFQGTDRSRKVDAWFTLSSYGTLQHQAAFDVTNRKVKLLGELFLRMPDGATRSGAESELRLAMTMLVAAYPDVNAIYARYVPTENGDFGTNPIERQNTVETARPLAAIVALILLIACANAANLLLLRGVRRRAEFAVRRSLGASSGRILRQCVVDGMVLTVIGGCAGTVVAASLCRLFSGFLTDLPGATLLLDWRVLAFGIALCTATGLLFGLVPGIAAIRQDSSLYLKEGARTPRGSQSRIRSILSVVQIAASMVLVVGALLLARTIINLHQVALGFEPHNVTVTTLDPSAQGYSPDRLHALRTGLLDWVGHQPGVLSVSLAATAPFPAWTSAMALRPVGAPAATPPVMATMFPVSSAYFVTLGVPLIAGRPFAAAEYDDTTAEAAIISQSAAVALFGSANPIGQRIAERVDRPRTVVGVVADSRPIRLRGKPTVAIYLPYGARSQPGIAVLVRTTRSPKEIERMVRDGVHAFDPALPIQHTEALTESVARAMSRERLFAQLLDVLAALAATLAAVGLYCVVAYSVAERTREIGIRMALGARQAGVVSMIIRRGLFLTSVGLVIGAVGALALSKLLASTLFGVVPTNPSYYLVAAFISLLASGAACVIPARAAAHINPVEALRVE